MLAGLADVVLLSIQEPTRLALLLFDTPVDIFTAKKMISVRPVLKKEFIILLWFDAEPDGEDTALDVRFKQKLNYSKIPNVII